MHPWPFSPSVDAAGSTAISTGAGAAGEGATFPFFHSLLAQVHAGMQRSTISLQRDTPASNEVLMVKAGEGQMSSPERHMLRSDQISRAAAWVAPRLLEPQTKVSQHAARRGRPRTPLNGAGRGRTSSWNDSTSHGRPSVADVPKQHG